MYVNRKKKNNYNNIGRYILLQQSRAVQACYSNQNARFPEEKFMPGFWTSGAIKNTASLKNDSEAFLNRLNIYNKNSKKKH